MNLVILVILVDKVILVNQAILVIFGDSSESG